MKEELEEPTSFVVMVNYLTGCHYALILQEPRLRKNSSPIEAIQDSITLCTFPVGKDGVDGLSKYTINFNNKSFSSYS